jgi:hypothetical protein
MKEMNKKNYMSPVVETLNARVEKGFAGSGDSTLGSGALPPRENQEDLNMNDFD